MVCVRIVVPVDHLPHVELHGLLVALAYSARSFALSLVETHFQSVPLLPRLKTQNYHFSLWC